MQSDVKMVSQSKQNIDVKSNRIGIIPGADLLSPCNNVGGIYSNVTALQGWVRKFVRPSRSSCWLFGPIHFKYEQRPLLRCIHHLNRI